MEWALKDNKLAMTHTDSFGLASVIKYSYRLLLLSVLHVLEGTKLRPWNIPSAAADWSFDE